MFFSFVFVLSWKMRNSNGRPVQNSMQKFENHIEISKYEWMTQLKQHSGGVGAVCQMAKKRPLISIHSRQIYPAWTRPTWLAIYVHISYAQTHAANGEYVSIYSMYYMDRYIFIYIYIHMYIFAKSRSFRLRPKIRLYDLQECEANLIFHFYSFELRVFGIFNFIFLYTIYINMLVCVQFGDSTKFMNPGDDA